MKKVLQILFATLCMAMSIEVEAVPAYPHPIQFTQPDGSVLTIRSQGDEYIHWQESIDGYTLMFNKDGYLTYAQQDEHGNLQPSGIIATDIDKRDVKASTFLSSVAKSLFYSDEQVSVMTQVSDVRKRAEEKLANKEVVGNYNTVCALVQFPSKDMKKGISEFESLMNQIGYSENGRTGSVKDYFLESSYDKFNLTVKLAGPYTAPKEVTYYAGSNGTAKGSELASWLASKANEDIDYSECDGDGDGVVDNFHFIFAGYGQETTTVVGDIWSHSSYFETLTLDGKTLDRYSCSPELKGYQGETITDVGVIAHEISHAFGSPDYYDVDYSKNGLYDGTGRWDIMGTGCWNDSGNCPSHHNSYQKMLFGWVKPVELTEPITIRQMPNSTKNAVVYKVSTSTNNEYFLIENKQKIRFDAFIPGHGLLIYRVHKDVDVNVRTMNTTHPQKMYPVCASATTALPTSAKSTYGTINGTGCTFPGSKNRTLFTDDTKPSMKSWSEQNTGKPITDIVENGDLVTFKFMGGNSVNYIVTIAPTEHGTITVNNGDNVITSGTEVEEGTILTISNSPDSGYELESISVNNSIITGNTFEVEQESTISARFREATSVNELQGNAFAVFAHNDIITIKNKKNLDASIDVVDMSGRIIHQSKIQSTQTTIEIPKTGIYVVRVKNNNEVKTYKIIIKNI